MKKKTNIIYWISTGLVAVMCVNSGIQNIMLTEFIRNIDNLLSIPLYLSPFFGTLKLLGAVTILIPQLKRFHEAAYAGLIFYFIGATYVNIAGGNVPSGYILTATILIAVVVSYLSSLKRNNEKLSNAKVI